MTPAIALTCVDGPINAMEEGKGEGVFFFLIQTPPQSSEKLTGRFTSNREVGGDPGWKGGLRPWVHCVAG